MGFELVRRVEKAHYSVTYELEMIFFLHFPFLMVSRKDLKELKELKRITHLFASLSQLNLIQIKFEILRFQIQIALGKRFSNLKLWMIFTHAIRYCYGNQKNY